MTQPYAPHLIFTSPRPTLRYDLGLTLHTDGTVSYWDCDTQSWHRRAVADISAAGWEYMSVRERKQVRAHA
jgi:hypothetical protein